MKRSTLLKFRKIVNDYMFLTFKDLVYVAILTAFSTFVSFIIHVRTEAGTLPGFVVIYFGFPLEWFRINANIGAWYSTLSKFEILWASLAVDVIVFVLLSIFLVQVADKVAERVRERMS